MPRKHTPSFILELPLRTSPADERACAIMPARNIGNATLGETRLMRGLRCAGAGTK
jgi:hypothetical protein